MTRSSRPRVRGTVSRTFEPVREAFAENFRSRGELGAACAVYHRGEPVVDLWGGFRDADATEPWTDDTRVLVFSATKGIAAATVAIARSRGLFEYDDRVADHWPAFARGGKGSITVRQLLGHRAGLAAPGRTLPPELVADRDALAGLLARKEPDWEPGTRHGYHAFTLGWYQSELLRRTDPDGRTVGEFFAAEVADPLDLAISIGRPEAVPGPIAEIDGFHPLELLANLHRQPPRMVLSLLNPWSLTARALAPFPISTPAELDDPAYRSVEIPSGNGIVRVRDLAKLYGLLATGGENVGVGRETVAELTAPPTRPPGGWRDLVVRTDAAYALGFSKPLPDRGDDFGSSTAAFGAPGAGGSFAFADPDRELGFAYAPNRLGTHFRDDPRERALRDAVYECLPAG